MRLSEQAVVDGDFEALAALRLQAMRDSLQALGRYDPVRSRERLLAGFRAELARHILVDERRVGFYLLDTGSAAWRLQHLYLLPEACGQGIGARVMAGLCERARRAGASLTLSALKGSSSNHFYLAQGFVPIGASEWDIDYCWTPPADTAVNV